MQTKAPYDARAVANFLLDLADSRRHSLTQMSVLKLIYFAHGWYLAHTSQPFVTQDFEAWKRGPVIKVVRDEFKHFGDQPITGRASRLDIYSGQRHDVDPDLAAHDKLFVEAIYNGYHEFDAWQLSP